VDSAQLQIPGVPSGISLDPDTIEVLNNEIERLRHEIEINDYRIYELEDQLETGKTNFREIKTLGGRDAHSGGFGALTFKFTEFGNENLVTTGLRGGWIINRSVAIGLEGHGLIPTAKFSDIAENGQAVLLGGYGGMFVEPVIFSNQIVHLTFPVAGGAGWLGYHEDWEQEYNDDYRLISDDVFWYVEPGAMVELNVARPFRIGFGASWRFTEDLEMLNTAGDAFENINYQVTLKFGCF
jgi:hypothetical protein